MRGIKIGILVLLISFNTNAQELYNSSNAASISNESNSTDGWITNGTILTSDATNVYHGSYAIRAESPSTDANGRQFRYVFSAVVGETYDISIWAKQGNQGVSQAFAAWTGMTGFTTPTKITSTSWTEYTFTVTATNTAPAIVVYTGSSVQGDIGDVVFLDRISIVPQNVSDTQAPTAPTLTSSAHAQTTVDLAWSGATDNVGVTGYRVFKDNVLEATLGNVSAYQVTGLSASTIYQFKVNALDAAGNESPDSNILNVTTNAAPGGISVWSESGSVASYSGDVAVGASSVPSGYKLAVEGKIRTREVRVDQDSWPDYVFEEGYELLPLEDLQKFIERNGHLPNVPSLEEVMKNGVQLGEMDKVLLEKIEELTLHILNQEKRIKQLEEIIQNLKQ